MTLATLDGRTVRVPLSRTVDVVIIGSGPAGSTAARECARQGLSTLVVEEGLESTPAGFPQSAWQSMAAWYRDLGTSVAFGPALIPYLQGRGLGGTSVVNGAICWRTPRDVYDAWVRADAALADALPFEAIARAEAFVEERLGVEPTDASVAGAKNLLLAKGAEALGLEHRPIRRNVTGCRGSGRCLQGCPTGAKASVDRTFLRDAVEAFGAAVFTGVTATRVLHDGRRAHGIAGVTAAGAPVTVHARRAVILAASAIQTPLLLRASGLGRGPVGDGLEAHPGVSVTGRFDVEVNNHLGATQGHEVIGLRHEGLKFEALGFDLSILMSRLPGGGAPFAERLSSLSRVAVWGVAVRASARGSVRSVGGRTVVTYALERDDVARVRRGVRVLAELFLAAGAVEVYPGVTGLPTSITTPAEAAALERDGPLDARAWSMSMTHLFSTARLGSDRQRSVVRPDFRHHDVEGLFVADSSVFPSNTGVNPQVAIMGLAHLCAEHVARAA
jgi:choline dehydrogenase-like flavoprotein